MFSSEASGARTVGRCGFTLIEVMMTVVIIGVLIGMVLAIAGYVAGQSDKKKAVADMEKIKMQLEEYRVRNETYPGSFAPLVSSGLSLTDSWGRIYEYKLENKYKYRLWSGGPDGIKTTNDDIETSTGRF